MITNPPRIEIQQLAHFVLACQSPTLAETARELGIAPSALTSSLRTLENELQLKLFIRKSGHLSPLPAAFWLFQQATAILHRERFVRRMRNGGTGPLRIDIRLDLSFSIGRFSKAIGRTVEDMERERPDLLIDVMFADMRGKSLVEDGAAEIPGNASSMEIEVGYMTGVPSAKLPAMTPFYDEVWFSVGTAEAAVDLRSPNQKFVVLKMRQALRDAVTRYADEHGIRDRMILMDEEPADLHRLLNEFPQMRFLMPRSMVADRLGLARLHLEPLDPPLSSTLGVRANGPDQEVVSALLCNLKKNLEATEANIVFRPQLTARQLHYFNLAHLSGGISAAARAAHITQPSVSTQIQKIEAVVGQPLFERRRNGAESTKAGKALLPFTLEIEERIDNLLRASLDIAAHTQATISIGMLPSSGHDSVMTDKVAQALTATRLGHPEYRLRIIEGSNAALHDQVRAGELNLAIVGAVQTQMTRIHLGPSERLSVVANPALDLAGRTEIPLAEVCGFPLVLGIKHLSIHQAFMAAASARHLRVEPVMDVGSLPLAIAMVRRLPVCTVLPVSSVQQDIDSGRLTAAPITEDVIAGNLSVIFSGERTLSEAERTMIQSLAAVFGRQA
ncbi:LysR family transcriptional regulator [Rhizobium leguminosarum]|uniref:LysR family transcriptional regulator n=1 Tax=Rhizobium leguminosarum TaxID=384 RepID=UPI003F97E8B9